MELYQGVILGIVQGLTEFLPVSSSGHLVLGQIYFGMTESQLVFDISVHMGTMFAVIAVYFRDILNLLSSVCRFLSRFLRRRPVGDLIAEDEELHMAGMIIVGSVPTAIIGLALKKIEHILFTSTLLVGCMLVLTGTLLWVSRKYYDQEQSTIKGFGIRKAGFIGLVQGCAVIPGISRSGSTIAAGMFMGLDRATAAKFSFLLSIPAIMGAELLGIKEMVEKGVGLDMVTICATIVAFITGYAALKILIRLVHAGRFHLFAPYCWFVGVLVLLSNFI